MVMLLGLMVLPSVQGARKKNKAGVVKDYVFTDKQFNYSLTLNEGWKYKVQKEKATTRLVLTKVDFGIPPDYRSAPDYTKIPRMVVSVVETNMGAVEYIDSLVSDSYNSDEKNEL